MAHQHLPNGDDMELGIRCCLSDIKLHYAPDLVVKNDLPGTFAATKSQRRRWTATFLRMVPRYSGVLLRRAMGGDKQAFHYLLFNLWVPSFSNLLILTSVLLLVLSVVAVERPSFVWWAAMGWGTCFSHILFLALTLRRQGGRLSFKVVRCASMYLLCRVVALFESVLMIKSKHWWPTPH